MRMHRQNRHISPSQSHQEAYPHRGYNGRSSNYLTGNHPTNFASDVVPLNSGFGMTNPGLNMRMPIQRNTHTERRPLNYSDTRQSKPSNFSRKRKIEETIPSTSADFHRQKVSKNRREAGNSSREENISREELSSVNPNNFRDLPKSFFESVRIFSTEKDPNAELSDLIWNYFRDHSQSTSFFKAKIDIWSKFDSVLYERFGASTHVFGSTLNGFGTDRSDMDICMFIKNNTSKDGLVSLLAEARRLLRRKCPSLDPNIELVPAKVPILKIYDTYYDIEIDLSCSNENAVRNTNLLYCYTQLDWRVRPLGIVIKKWAKNAGINDAKFSTMSSYTISLMVINYLQCGVTPPVLPSLQLLYPDVFKPNSNVFSLPFQKNVPKYTSANNESSLGKLLIGFFRYYDDYDFAAIAGSVRLAKTLPIEECQQYSQSLRDTPRQWEAYICMEEPFSQSNTGRAIIKRDQFDKILKAIRKASQYLSGPESDYSKFMNKCY